MATGSPTRTILVTGGAGFIGSHLAATLLDAGHPVRVVDNLSTGSRTNVPDGTEFIHGDLNDPAVVETATSGVEVVFHLAALGSVPRSIADPISTEQSNVLGSLSLFEAARRAGVQRIIAASSSSVYGGSDVRPISETVSPNPRSPYAVSKYAMERYLRVYAEIHGIETLALRYFNVFGPRQPADSAYAAVLPRWSRAILSGTSPVVYGDGEQTRDFTFVDDVVRANLAALHADAALCDGRAYNVAGGSEHSLNEVLKMFSSILGVELNPVHESPRVGDVLHSAADITRAATELGWRPQATMESGLATYLEWFRSSAT